VFDGTLPLYFSCSKYNRINLNKFTAVALYVGFWSGNLRERDHLGDPSVDGRIKLRWILRKWEVGVWTGSSWLSIVTYGRHL
jgi:hypothetical protein